MWLCAAQFGSPHKDRASTGCTLRHAYQSVAGKYSFFGHQQPLVSSRCTTSQQNRTALHASSTRHVRAPTRIEASDPESQSTAGRAHACSIWSTFCDLCAAALSQRGLVGGQRRWDSRLDHSYSLYTGVTIAFLAGSKSCLLPFHTGQHQAAEAGAEAEVEAEAEAKTEASVRPSGLRCGFSCRISLSCLPRRMCGLS